MRSDEADKVSKPIVSERIGNRRIWPVEMQAHNL